MGEWEVHSEHYLVVKVLMLAKMAQPLDTDVRGQSKIEGDFQILAIKPLGTKPVDPKKLEQDEWEKLQAELLSGKTESK